jgi:hypothetical protein
MVGHVNNVRFLAPVFHDVNLRRPKEPYVLGRSRRQLWDEPESRPKALAVQQLDAGFKVAVKLENQSCVLTIPDR